MSATPAAEAKRRLEALAGLDRLEPRFKVDLVDEGFTPCRGSWSEQQEARRMTCCGGGRELKAIELIGDQGELVANRMFAVCGTCRHWVEI